MDNKVALSHCEGYSQDEIDKLIESQFDFIGVCAEDIEGKRVVIKPNLLKKASPDKCITTHPTVINAVVKALKKYNPKSLIIAESGAGSYTESSIRASYKASGFFESAEEAGAQFNYDNGFTVLPYADGVVSKTFNVINPIVEADVIVNVCKLKSHSLTTLSCAVKNMYGVIPGTQKVEMHARFNDQKAFMEMLVDLNLTLLSSRKMICVCDGILGMEGNGPANGQVKKIGCLLSSKNPFALDFAATHIIKFEQLVYMLDIAKRRMLLPDSVNELTLSDDIESYVVDDFKAPDSNLSTIVSHLPAFLKPRPIVNKDKCVGCGRCAEACPKQIIDVLTLKNGKKRAKIHKAKCIRCFCCQELCPFDAIKIKQNFIFKLWR